MSEHDFNNELDNSRIDSSASEDKDNDLNLLIVESLNNGDTLAAHKSESKIIRRNDKPVKCNHW